MSYNHNENINIHSHDFKEISNSNILLLKENFDKKKTNSIDESNKNIITKENSLIFKRNKNWNKISNLITGINLLKNFETKYLRDDNDFIDKELKSYEYKLKYKQNLISVSNQDNKSDFLFRINYPKNEILKEKLIKNAEIILSNPFKNHVKEFKKLLNSNIDQNKTFSNQINNLVDIFNYPLSNGMTIIYFACKEGNFELVEFLLEKNLNPKIKIKVGQEEWENCLEVSCRWNYFNIVEILLKSGCFDHKDVEKCLKFETLTGNIKKLLNKYKKKDKFIKRCTCF